MALQVVDRAMQSFGAEGVSQDQPLAAAWANLRTLRFADVSDHARASKYHILMTVCTQGPDAVCTDRYVWLVQCR